jgi:phosphatidylinositol alpha-1,6-mannosyltransferase
MTRPLRLLLATLDYPPDLGGMAEYASAWAAGLAALGVEVRVVAKRRGEAESAQSSAVPSRDVMWRDGPLRTSIAAYQILAEEIRRERPDLVFAVTWIGWGPALAVLKGRLGVRYVVAAHGAEILGPQRSPWHSFLMRQALRGADRVFAVSRFTADHVTRIGLSKERIEVIPNGVDPRRFTPGPRDPELARRFGLHGREVILTVGGLVDRKGHDTVIRAMALLKDRRPNLRYLVAGGWSLASSREPFLRALVAELGIEERVVFTGFVRDEDLPAIYRLGDLFVMTGREIVERGWVEGFGISYLEAAASGLPIVATRAGGVEDAVTEENAVFVPPDDPAATAAAIEKLLDDSGRRNRMSESGLVWAAGNTWSRRVEEGYDLMKRICHA